ncbi:MAG: metallopeptidase TldD-related protein [Bryobacteraceae bacterium]
MKRRAFLAIPAALIPHLRAEKPEDDVVLRAMRDELARVKDLTLPGTAPVYFVEFALDDSESFSVTASLGSVVRSASGHSRTPRTQIRVGNYSFDNTNYIFSDFFARSGGQTPLEDDYDLLRHHFWLAADRTFKGSVEAISRKQSALRNITQQEKLNDFAKAEPTKLYLPSTKVSYKENEWRKRARDLSAVFADYPKITGSGVEVELGYGTSYLVNSEGTEYRFPDDLFFLRSRASAQAPDGMPVRDGVVFQARTPDRLPGESAMREGITEVAKNVSALLAAPVGEDYSGPVLFEDVASPQMFAHVLGANLGLTRRPVSEPGRPAPVAASELEGRIGSRILPEWMDAVDDPVTDSWNGEQLQGTYRIDMEGVTPQTLTVVEKGSVKNLLRTRQPVRGFEGSNGRARLPGAFGAKAAVFSNLLMKATGQTMSPDDLKKKLLDMVSQRGKQYGIIVRKLDFPFSGPFDDLRRLASAAGQRGATRPATLPILVYRVYPDGREELVRGLRFRTLNVRSLRDIAAASNAEKIFHFIGDGSPLPVMGGGGYVSTHSVVAPAVLFEDLELEKREEDWPKLPLVPPPDLISSR